MRFLSALLLTATLFVACSPPPARPAANGITRITYETTSGGRLGGYSRLAITADSTTYVEGTRGTRKATRAKTAKATWDALLKAINLSSFRQLKSQPSQLPVDGTDVTLTITQGKETISRTNSEEDVAHYKAIQPWVKLLDAQLTQAAAKAK